MKDFRRLKFSMKYDLVEMAESEIMKVKMYIVSEGNNHHNMPISWEAILAAKPTLVGKPIVAKYNKWNKDLMGHEKDEVPIGVILREEDIFEEEDENGKKWLGAYGDIWMRYSQDVTGVLVRDMIKDLSMEIIVAEESDMGDINAFAFTGVTLIGTSPAIKDARVEVLTFEEVKDGIEKIVNFSEEEQKSNQIADLVVDKLFKKLQEKDGEQMKKDENFEATVEEEVVVEPVEEKSFAEEEKEVEMACGDKKMEEDSECESEDEEKEEESKEVNMGADAFVENSAQEAMAEKEAEDGAEMAEEQNKPEMMEIEVTKYEEYERIVGEYEKLKVDYEAMKEDKDVYMSELETLKEFKAGYDKSVFETTVAATFAEVIDAMPSEVIDEFRESSKNFTIDNISEWQNSLRAKAFTYVSKKEPKSKHISIDIPRETESKKKGLWD